MFVVLSFRISISRTVSSKASAEEKFLWSSDKLRGIVRSGTVLVCQIAKLKFPWIELQAFSELSGTEKLFLRKKLRKSEIEYRLINPNWLLHARNSDGSSTVEFTRMT